MVNVKEETINIDIFQGMTQRVPKSDRYCGLVSNFVKTAPNELTIREDFVMLQEQTRTVAAIANATNPVPMSTVKNEVEVFQAIGSTSADSPTLIFAYDNGVTREVVWLNMNSATPVSTTQTLSVAARGIKAFCQYKDRYYASNFTSTIFRVSNFVTGGPTLTVTDLISIAGVNIMVAFKNRIFGIARNRIYYTDIPTIGGYPETWNSTVNFVDLPSIDYDISVLNAFVYKDRLYMFTDRGIYYLTANGDPVNWSIQNLTNDFPIVHRDSVCVNKNIIYITDQQSVVAFNGVAFKKISDPMKEIFFNVPAAAAFFTLKVYPHENGVLLHRTTYSSAANYTCNNTTDAAYYFDQEIWVAVITNLTATTNGMFSIVKAGVNLAPFRGKVPGSWIYYISDIAAGVTRLRCIFLDSGQWRGDTYTVDHVSGLRVGKNLQIKFPFFALFQHTYMRIKYFVAYMYFNPTSFGSAIFSSTGFSVNNLHLVTSAEQGGNNKRWKIGSSISQYVKAYESIIFTVTNANTGDINFGNGSPPIILYGLEAIVNTDNKAITEPVNY